MEGSPGNYPVKNGEKNNSSDDEAHPDRIMQAF
jgi:hypothetical protein